MMVGSRVSPRMARKHALASPASAAANFSLEPRPQDRRIPGDPLVAESRLATAFEEIRGEMVPAGSPIEKSIDRASATLGSRECTKRPALINPSVAGHSQNGLLGRIQRVDAIAALRMHECEDIRNPGTSGFAGEIDPGGNQPSADPGLCLYGTASEAIRSVGIVQPEHHRQVIVGVVTLECLFSVAHRARVIQA